jgi:hypothetical protein
MSTSDLTKQAEAYMSLFSDDINERFPHRYRLCIIGYVWSIHLEIPHLSFPLQLLFFLFILTSRWGLRFVPERTF